MFLCYFPPHQPTRGAPFACGHAAWIDMPQLGPTTLAPATHPGLGHPPPLGAPTPAWATHPSFGHSVLTHPGVAHRRKAALLVIWCSQARG
eukprot:3625314-Pyramimonas_sp.AAC.1